MWVYVGICGQVWHDMVPLTSRLCKHAVWATMLVGMHGQVIVALMFGVHTGICVVVREDMSALIQGWVCE